ncbi:hypothetical protein [Leptolyngbya sp. UWPOB_LEPTO1]|uniref:hypothetical protein n=1 Tax=Leptolyngbya sp. UWPOB_LEPTO1 TaxID=2815653 RepID=UPI00257AE487|nr:hypothetical protein [Leptolyngbya sp. UWPOB_LEPTO1]
MSFTDSRFCFHRFAVTSILTLNTFVFLNAPTSLKAKEIRDCSIAVADAQKRLTKDGNLEVTMRSSDISEGSPDHPEHRPIAYEFFLRGSAAASIMHSRQFQKAIAIDIIENCSSVGSVTFGVSGSGWIQTVGILPSGKIDTFECLDPPRRDSSESNSKLTWGQEYCSL